jgi:3-hydroxymyristoyl/3-hydroxydecanoyl-(acyl carrier protein) dehydratase
MPDMMCEPVVRAVERTAEGVVLALDLPADLACFRGHYAGFPILPAVVQIDWVMRLGVAHMQCPLPSATDFRVKFRRVITPGNPLLLTLQKDAPRRRLDFVYRLGDAVASQGRVTLPSA